MNQHTAAPVQLLIITGITYVWQRRVEISLIVGRNTSPEKGLSGRMTCRVGKQQLTAQALIKIYGDCWVVLSGL